MKTLCVTALSLLFIAPLSASAQSFTVLPVERDARVPAAERMAAFSAVQSARVLGPSAIFEPVGTLVDRLPDDQRGLAECLEVECAARLARESGLDAVLVVAVWPDGDGRAGTVAVTMVGPGGGTFEADAEVGEGGVSEAATRAVVAAARRRNMGTGAELRVDSMPHGALVLVDGTEVGVTPFVGAFAAGEHTVEVRLRGESETRTVVLSEDDEDAALVEVSLPIEIPDEAGPGAPAEVERPSQLNWWLGGGLIALGVVATIPPIYTAAKGGECTTMGGSGGCTEYASFGGASTALLIVGLAAAATGAVFLIAQPLTVSVAADENGATVGVSGRF